MKQLKNNNFDISYYNSIIDSAHFAVENQKTLNPYYIGLNNVQAASSVDKIKVLAIIQNPNLSFEQKQVEIVQITSNQAFATSALISNPVNSFSSELAELFLVDSKPFHHSHINALNNATNTEELTEF